MLNKTCRLKANNKRKFINNGVFSMECFELGGLGPVFSEKRKASIASILTTSTELFS